MISEIPHVDSSLGLIIEKAFRQRRIDLRQYNVNFLQRRLNVRVSAKGVRDYSQYASLLDQDPTEYNELFQALSINVTEFFRDNDVYDAFYTHVLPKILNIGKQNEIRIWSAGCATGEEMYSVAILLNQASERYGSFKFKITGTDVSAKAIETARKSKCVHSSLKNLPEKILKKYFQQVSEEHYQINKNIMDSVTFNVGDILTIPTPNSLDVIFCRNIIIYFGRKAQDQLFVRFAHSLKPSAYLILGKTEMIKDGATSLFESVMPRERIYRKRTSAA